MVATMSVVMRGVKGGLEKAVLLLMPALLALLFLLVAYAMTTGEYYFQGLSFCLVLILVRLTVMRY